MDTSRVCYCWATVGTPPWGFLNMFQCHWRETLNEMYFSMLYPNSKLRFDFAVFLAKYEKLSEPYQKWSWRTAVYIWFYSYSTTSREFCRLQGLNMFSKEGRILASPFQKPDNGKGKRKNFEGDFLAILIAPPQKKINAPLWGHNIMELNMFSTVSFPFGLPISAYFHLKAQGEGWQ